MKKRRKAFYALMLLLEMGVVGFFLATDIFLFYVFFELTLVPMYFIVGIWGGQRRIYAAIKFFLYTAVGSLLMLVAILYVYFSSGTGSFGYDAFMSAGLSLREQLWLFAAFALAFGIKVPIFPFHTWLPDAHVEAPTPGSVILASVLLKMGTYGFLRFLLPFFPRPRGTRWWSWSCWCWGWWGSSTRRGSRRSSPMPRSSSPTPPWPTWGSS